MVRPQGYIEAQDKEARMAIRVPVRLPVTIELRPLLLNLKLQAVTHNLSFDGALIEASKPAPPKGAEVRLLLESAPNVHLVIDALVVRSTDHGVALMFTENAKGVLKSLSEILTAGFH